MHDGSDIRVMMFGRDDTVKPRRYRLCVTCFVSVLAVTVAAVAFHAVAQGAVDDEHTPFFVVQLADPQFGLQHSNVEWQEEAAMLNLSILTINRLAPRFVVLTGDMQNFLPTSTGATWPMQKPDGIHHAHPGADQVASLMQCLSLLDASIPIRASIPGNHDIGYAPTVATLERFESLWGTPRASFDEGGVAFVAIDSQLYFNATQPGVAALAEEETIWLSQQLDDAANRSVAGVVLFSHIPPFLLRADEPTGWANWPMSVRTRLLNMTQTKRVPPSLVINGHFHANVEGVTSTAFGQTTLELVTTSSVGCPIQYNGSSAPVLTHEAAAAFGAAPTGYDLFQTFIVRNGSTAATAADFGLIPDRIRAAPDVSGVRVFEFDARRGYRHAWFTLETLGQLGAPLRTGGASPLARQAFTSWA